MKKKKTNKIMLIAVAVILILLFCISSTLMYGKTRDKLIEEEKQGMPETVAELDVYDMHDYCSRNSAKVLEYLKSGNTKALEKLMISSEGLDELMLYTDWSTADLDNTVSLGTGSLSAAPDADGKMDMSERIFVDTDNGRFVFFIETITSDNGKMNDGVSAIGVTSFAYFDSTDFEWNGEAGDDSVLAGKLFRDKE